MALKREVATVPLTPAQELLAEAVQSARAGDYIGITIIALITHANAMALYPYEQRQNLTAIVAIMIHEHDVDGLVEWIEIVERRKREVTM